MSRFDRFTQSTVILLITLLAVVSIMIIGSAAIVLAQPDDPIDHGTHGNALGVPLPDDICWANGLPLIYGLYRGQSDNYLSFSYMAENGDLVTVTYQRNTFGIGYSERYRDYAPFPGFFCPALE